ncbi:UNVERIFIED_CONTAM: hypothetical protein Sradi_3567100 [Sesamum radiatum]|uniref:Uncharacterized protein n=1 Tax=Sesamum radiatum TaxID=300843 RepID=A0AAW2QFW8_SESRA
MPTKRAKGQSSFLALLAPRLTTRAKAPRRKIPPKLSFEQGSFPATGGGREQPSYRLLKGVRQLLDWTYIDNLPKVQVLGLFVSCLSKVTNEE